MKSGKPVVNPFGFTIVEVLVVLTVTLVILTSAILAVSGRTQTAVFMQELNEVQSNFQSIMNDVSTGNFNTNSITCNVNTGSQMLQFPSSVPTDTGDCELLGEAVLFTTGNIYYGFPVFGARQNINPPPVELSTTYMEAQPTIAPSPPGTALVKATSLSNELVAQWAKYQTTVGAPVQAGTETNMVAFLDDPNAIGTPPPTSNASSGAIGVNTIPVQYSAATSLNTDPGTTGALTTATDAVNASLTNTTSLKITADAGKNPAGGFGVCFKSQSTNQSVLYTFGGANRNATIENTVYSGDNC